MFKSTQIMTQSRRAWRALFTLLLSAAVLSMAQPAHAALFGWHGNATPDTDWSTPGNWGSESGIQDDDTPPPSDGTADVRLRSPSNVTSNGGYCVERQDGLPQHWHHGLHAER
ncbi:MAG: hypothetical protein WD042_18330 [Phycisphaeraceae bacterium]